MLPEIREVNTDPRVRSFVLPTRVMVTQGLVNNGEAMLMRRPFQAHITESVPTMRLENREGHPPAGILLDFGRELVGGVRLLCVGTAGATNPRLRVRFGESASEALTPLGVKGACNDHAIRDMVIPMTAMSDQEWGQTGFRFVYLQLEEPEAAVTLKGVLAVFVRRDIPMRGSFRCSDPLLEQIYETGAYTCHLCMQALLWDGVKRDRLVWIGDTHPEMLTIRTAFGYQPVLEESLDFACEVTPLPDWMNTMPSYSLWWLLILRDWYTYTGQAAYPLKHKAYIQGLTDQLLGRIRPDGLLELPSSFLDWPSSQQPVAVEGVQALAVLAMEAAADLLTLCGDRHRVARVEEALPALRRYPATGEGSKPAVALLSLAGMLPPETVRTALLEGGDRGVSTFMSFYILTALARAAGCAEALGLLRSYYGGMLQMGATTFWEDFNTAWMERACPIDRIPAEGERDIHGDFGAYCYEKFRHSLCHGWASGPVPFLMETVLGISFAVPGGQEITLCPDLGDLTWAEGVYPLPDGGDLWVRCERTATGVTVEYRAPAGVTVTVQEAACRKT